MLIELEPAFLIHTRAYRDTSLLLEAFTRNHGRVSLVARGVRGKKGSRSSLLQPFAPLLISWWGRGELGTLRNTELHQQPYWLTANRLASGFYVNELLHRLLGRHEAHPELFDYYASTIFDINSLEINQLARTLRLFEKFLITQLGYGLLFNVDAFTGSPIQSDLYYSFSPEIGCYQCRGDWGDRAIQHLYKGSSLLALHSGQFSLDEELQDAKRLMRSVLAAHLGEKPLYSRSLWR
ncbi:MAG: DNA repair protein RecO [Gammaproteobacteria bacterium]